MIPGSERSPGEGNGNPIQYACLGNSMDRGAWQATVHGLARVGHDLATKPHITTLALSFSSYISVCVYLNCWTISYKNDAYLSLNASVCIS